MTCPVGGERFSAWQPAMYSTYGERPDGKPYSYLPFPFPLPECPSNKLIVFGKFSTQETAALAQAIATPAYRQLIGAETSYYRAYWLSTKLGRPRRESLGLLLSAIWQVSPDAAEKAPSRAEDARRRRYQALLVREVQRLGPAVAPQDRALLQARAANAAREMGAFREAEALRVQAMASLAGLSDKRGWDGYLFRLDAVIARRDSSIEPLDMIPEQQAASICERARPSNAFDRAVCVRIQNGAAKERPR